MITGNTNAQIASTSATRRSFQVRLGCNVTSILRASMLHTNTRPAARSSAGTIPATNRLLMEVLVVTPKMMKGMEGGTMGAITPPAAIKPAERGTG